MGFNGGLMGFHQKRPFFLELPQARWMVYVTGNPWKSQVQKPAGKRLHSVLEHHHFSMGKSTNSMAIFDSKLLVYQRVNPP